MTSRDDALQADEDWWLDEPYELDDDYVCQYCDGDGMDPLNDYVLECPQCGGAG